MNKIRFTTICRWEFIANQGIISVTSGGNGQRDAKGRNMLQARVQEIFYSHFIPDLTLAHNKYFVKIQKIQKKKKTYRPFYRS